MVNESILAKNNIVSRIIKGRVKFLQENNLIPNEIVLTPEDYNVWCQLYLEISPSFNLGMVYAGATFMDMKLKVECIPTTLLRYTCEMTI